MVSLGCAHLSSSRKAVDTSTQRNSTNYNNSEAQHIFDDVKDELFEEEAHSSADISIIDLTNDSDGDSHYDLHSDSIKRTPMKEEFDLSMMHSPSRFGCSFGHDSPRHIFEDVKDEPFEEAVHPVANNSDGYSHYDLNSDDEKYSRKDALNEVKKEPADGFEFQMNSPDYSNSIANPELKEEFDPWFSTMHSLSHNGRSIGHGSPRPNFDDVKKEPFEEAVHPVANDSYRDSHYGLYFDDVKYNPKVPFHEVKKEPTDGFEENFVDSKDQLYAHADQAKYISKKNVVDTSRSTKPYSRKVCRKKFVSKSNLTTYMLTHTEDDPLTCIVCDKTLSSKTALKHHYRTHTGEKPYACNLCTRRFRTKYVRNTHLRTHPENMFECKECPGRFSSMKALRIHYDVRHL